MISYTKVALLCNDTSLTGVKWLARNYAETVPFHKISALEN